MEGNNIPKNKDEMRKLIRAVKNKEKVSESSKNPDELFTEDEVWRAVTSQQDGDAYLTYRLLKGQVCYDKTAGKWYEYTGHHWKEDELDEIIRRVDAVIDIYSLWADRMAARETQATKKGKGDDKKEAQDKRDLYLKKISTLQKKRWKQDVLELAASGKESLAITGREWDLDPWLLGCSNGVIELKTGNFRPGRPEDFIKTVCPTEWKGIDEPRHAWEIFVSEILNNVEPMTSFIQRLMGCSITGSVIDHILPIFWGQGRNGKGTFFDTLRFTCGPLAEPIKAEILLDQGRVRSSASPDADIMSLRGRRIVWASETDEGRKLNVGKVKWLVGGDILKGREPYGRKEVSFTPTHTLFLLTNHKPRVDPNDYALWQRIHLIEFTMSFIDNPLKPNEKKRDPHLPEKLRAEASGILAWLVRGCLKWQEQGLNPPKEVKEATAAYKENEDDIGRFIAECCYISPDSKVKAKDLRDTYDAWCLEFGTKPISGKRFSQYIRDRFDISDRTNTGFYYLGIGLIN